MPFENKQKIQTKFQPKVSYIYLSYSFISSAYLLTDDDDGSDQLHEIVPNLITLYSDIVQMTCIL